jgi:demethylmenaquinone methyltransferase/2-methoxy-6-polyprenyl-1,4-benzoquinol methylase
MDASPPHSILPRYYRRMEERRDFVDRLFDGTAKDYDWITRCLSFGSGAWYRRQALLRAGLAPGMRVLDVATGTGQVAAAIRKVVGPRGSVVGLDRSGRMLAVARRNLDLTAVRASAEALPFAGSLFDFLSMGYALRHVADLAPTFAEYRRILVPGGRLLILELTPPEDGWRRRLLKAWLDRFVPLIARLGARSSETATLMEYFWDTIDRCVPPASILDALRGAGLTGVERHVVLGIFSEYRAVRPGS